MSGGSSICLSYQASYSMSCGGCGNGGRPQRNNKPSGFSLSIGSTNRGQRRPRPSRARQSGGCGIFAQIKFHMGQINNYRNQVGRQMGQVCIKMKQRCNNGLTQLKLKIQFHQQSCQQLMQKFNLNFNFNARSC